MTHKFDTINVIPFIDIMLVLLAIVLTTATFISNGQLDIALPNAVSDSATAHTEKVEIAIDKNEALFINGKATEISQLEAELQILPVETAVLLRIDESVPFNRFITVIDLLKVLQLNNVSVITNKSTASTQSSNLREGQ